MTQFRGAFTALVTPMTESGEVDYDGFRRLIEFQMAEGIDGIVPLGTTGESPTLDEDEEEKLIEIAMKMAGGKIPVIVGSGSNDTKHMVTYVQRAKRHGADAALVVTPTTTDQTTTAFCATLKPPQSRVFPSSFTTSPRAPEEISPRL